MTTTTKQPLTATQLAKRAIKRSLRPDGALCRLGTDTGAAVNAAVNNDATGTWCFENDSHIIRLGINYISAMRRDACNARSVTGRERAAVEFGVRILRHEAWHGRVTVRDLNTVAKQCRSRSIPFVLVNLMEDMRLEHLARESENVLFGWHSFMDTSVATNPMHALMNMVLHETPHCSWFTPVNHPKFSTHSEIWREKVQEFAKRIKAAADTWAVIDIAQEWLEYWRAEGWADDTQRVPKGPNTSGSIGGDTDGSEAAFTQDRTATPTQTVSNNSQNTAHVSHREPRRVPAARFTYDAGAGRLNSREAEAIANEMRTILARTTSQHSARTSTSGSRLHIAGIAANSERAFRSYGKTGGKPYLVTLLDFSGSMARDWHTHGRLFAAAVLRLLRSGQIEGKVFATGGGMLAEIPATTTDDQLSALSPHLQGENIRDSLTALRRDIEQANAVLVYTDGELIDGHVDAGEWRRKGVDLVGSVVIPAHKGEAFREKKIAMMTNHFGAPVTAENGKTLARKLAQHLGARWR